MNTLLSLWKLWIINLLAQREAHNERFCFGWKSCYAFNMQAANEELQKQMFGSSWGGNQIYSNAAYWFVIKVIDLYDNGSGTVKI